MPGIEGTIFPELPHVVSTALSLLLNFNSENLWVPDVGSVFDAAPTYTDEIALDGDFTATWQVGHEGVPVELLLTTVITPAGSTDPNASREFSQLVTLNPGNNSFEVIITAADLAAAGIVPGRQVVAFLVLDGEGNRVGGDGFFGNLLTIGNIDLNFLDRPAFEPQVPAGGDFNAEFEIGNDGDTADVVTLTVVFTQTGGGEEIEVSRTVTVNPGGGIFNFHLTAGDLAMLNITPGLYTLTFLAFGGNDELIGDGFFAALIEFLFG